MNAQELLQEISDFCRQTGLAESTFGRRAVNDGKLASRLRNGGRITTETLDRIRGFMASNRNAGARPAVIERAPDQAHDSATAETPPGPRPIMPLTTMSPSITPTTPLSVPATAANGGTDPQRNFRFFDNRQKYLLFVNTCSEKWVVASRVALELGNIHPRPPAVRLFDAGVGDGSVLLRVMRSMHDRFPHMPFYVVGKEISLEDVRLTMQKMADRFLEHPATVLVLTNLAYADAPWLAVKSLSAASSMVWHEVPLTGSSAHQFEQQITDLEPFLAENWKAGVSPKTGNPVYERPVVLVIYREDHKFLLDPIIPKPGGTVANYDLVIASQPYRARASLDFKAKRVIAPLARALGPGGRLIAIHSHGHDPGMEIIQKVWPGDNPFIHDRHQILKAVKHELGPAGRDLNFNAYADNRSLFRYDMHTLPTEISGIVDRHLDAVRGLERRDLRGADRGRPARGGRRRRPLSRRDARGAAEAWRAVVLRRVLRDLAPARVNGRPARLGQPFGSWGRLALLPALCNDRRQGGTITMSIVADCPHQPCGAWSCVVALVTVASPAGAQTMGLATMQPGSLNHTTGTAIAKVAKEKGGLNMLVQPTAGETVIIPLVARGEAEFGLANALEVSVATENNRLPELRLIGVLHPLPTAFFVRKDTTMRTMADVKGKKVVWGFSAQRVIDIVSRGRARHRRPDRARCHAGAGAECGPRRRRLRGRRRRHVLLRIWRAQGARGGRDRRRHPRARDPGERHAGRPQDLRRWLSGSGRAWPILYRRRQADGRLHLGQSYFHECQGEGRGRLQDDRGVGEQQG